MRIVEENWKVLASLFHCFPQGGGNSMVVRCVERLRRFPSLDVLLPMLMLHVAHGPLSIFQGSNVVHKISTPAAPFRTLP
jgi:hypothetical protein